MTDTSGVPQRTKRGLDYNVAAELGDLLHELTQDKKFRAKIGRVIKEAKPESAHAQAFADVDLEDRQEAWERKQEEKEIKAAQERAVARMAAQRESLLTGGADGAGRKYSEEDVKKIEALMERKGLTDYDDAATLYAATLPPITKPENEPMRHVHGETWEIPEFAKFAKDPRAASFAIAREAIDELARRKR